MRLADYDIDTERGFLPGRDPLTALPAAFAAWDQVAADLSLLVMTGRVRAVLGAMPVLDAAGLQGKAEQERALLLLTSFASAWMASEPATLTIPRPIAVPLVTVARALDRVPITTHSNVVLGNWRRLDPAAPLSADNIDTLVTFRGSIDEKWFFLSTVGVELEGAPALPRLVAALDAAEAEDDARLADELAAIAAIITRVTAAFMRVRESCDPYIFYRYVRPYISGWPAPGVTYEGTDVGPVVYSGGSAAQSSLLQLFDAGLGIGHEHALTKGFLTGMQSYMPPRHRAFITDVRARTHIRLRAGQPEAPETLVVAYDAAVGAMDELRRKHIGLVGEYIKRQMAPDAVAVGTGGTHFDDFLRQSRVETVQAMVGAKSRQ